MLPGEARTLPVDLQIGSAFVVDVTLGTSSPLLLKYLPPKNPDVWQPCRSFLRVKATLNPKPRSQRVQRCNHGALATAWRQFLASSHTWRKLNSSSPSRCVSHVIVARGWQHGSAPHPRARKHPMQSSASSLGFQDLDLRCLWVCRLAALGVGEVSGDLTNAHRTSEWQRCLGK